MEITWLIKLALAHMITDFILQPRSWVEARNARHFSAPQLYIHGIITAAVAGSFVGWRYWPVIIIILISHVIIDGWKSYQKQNITFFLLDQLFHLLVIFICWAIIFLNIAAVKNWFNVFNSGLHFWLLCFATIFVTTPAAILIGFMTKKWREQLEGSENLANAGKWIGIIERLIILVFVIMNQYSAIGLLVAAKGIIRFNEKDRQEIKTEYLVIGTLMSIIIAVIAGLITKIST